MAKKFIIFFVLLLPLQSFASLVFFPDQNSADLAFSEAVLNSAFVGVVANGTATGFNSLQLNQQVSTTVDGHSCDQDLIFWTIFDSNFNGVTGSSAFVYCADGYMGSAPTSYAVSTGDIAFFIFGMVGFGSWLIFK